MSREAVWTGKYSLGQGLISLYSVHDSDIRLASNFEQIQKENIVSQLEKSLVKGETQESRILYGIGKELPFQMAMSSVDVSEGSSVEDSFRKGAAHGLEVLSRQSIRQFWLALDNYIQPAAEGMTLATYKYKTFNETVRSVQLHLLGGSGIQLQSFYRGMLMGSAENVARYLVDSPANKCTPIAFCSVVQDLARKIGPSLNVMIKDRDWVEVQGMGAFLSVASGSEQPPRFLIIEYKGTGNQLNPIVLVGKGVTFDSGGISLKPANSMASMKGDMAGGAAVASSILGCAAASLPLFIVGLVPLTENMPSGRATKPGDVVTALDGKTIEVDNTDAEGRLILADALLYAQKTYAPLVMIDVATLTGAVGIALGSRALAVFTSDDNLFRELEHAGEQAANRVWRMPLWKDYRSAMDSTVATIKNGSGDRKAGSCTAAAFLQEFVGPIQKWAHLDTAGIVWEGNAMSGRPTRLLLHWLFSKCEVPNITRDAVEIISRHEFPF